MATTSNSSSKCTDGHRHIAMSRLPPLYAPAPGTSQYHPRVASSSPTSLSNQTPLSNLPVPSRSTQSFQNTEATRQFSSSGFPSMKSFPKLKENRRISQPHRLLGPVSPSRVQRAQTLPQTQSMSVLASLSSKFTKPRDMSKNGNTNKRSAFLVPTLQCPPTVATSCLNAPAIVGPAVYSECKTSSLLITRKSTYSSMIEEAQPDSYWCGRFQSLVDRYHNELLAPDRTNIKEAIKCEDRTLSPSTLTKFDKLYSDHAGHAKRAFNHLSPLCATEEARESLSQFRKRYNGYARRTIGMKEVGE